MMIDRSSLIHRVALPNKVLLRCLVSLAVLFAVVGVGHDLAGRKPFWYSRQRTIENVMRRAARATRPVTELRRLSPGDLRNIDAVVACLAATDAKLRNAASRWGHELLDSQTLATHCDPSRCVAMFFDSLYLMLPQAPVETQRLAAELAERGLAMQFTPAMDEAITARCRQIVEATRGSLARPPTVTAPLDQPNLPSKAARFEDQFMLPGGGL